MQLKEVKWNSLVFGDRVILKKDLKIMSKSQVQSIMELNVEKVRGQKYKVSV